MRRLPSMVFISLLSYACDQETGKETTPPGSDDTDAVIDTDPFNPPADDTDHQMPEVDHRRPLCKEPATPPAMDPLLQAWADNCYDGPNRFVGDQTLYRLDALGELNLGTTDAQVLENRVSRGYERLRAGRVDDAITDLQLALDLAISTNSELRGRVRELLGQAWMRRGELDNCIMDGSGAACLVPFSDEAVHARTEGMTNAAELWTAFLTEDDPTKPAPRWLLNVCHMALGDFPDGVPAQWRGPDDMLVPEATLPMWPNVAPSLGIAERDYAGTAALEDFDGDGLLDILFSSHNPKRGARLYLNQGDGDFCEASDQSGLSAITGMLHASVEDYDNDGDWDIAGPRAGWYSAEGLIRMSLLRNDGQGHFTDVAVQAGLADTVGPSQVAAWADVNGDGWIDLFVGREKAGDTYPSSSMYMNQGDGTFEDWAPQVGLEINDFVKGAAFGDMDNDGDPDLYVSVMAGDNHLFRNDRDERRFTDITRATGTKGPRASFSTWWFDYDQDGWLDLFATGYPITFVSRGPLSDDFGRAVEGYIEDIFDLSDDGEHAALYHNLSDGFEDVSVELALDDVLAPMGTNFGDLNVDGWPDIYMGTGSAGFDALDPSVAYLNQNGQRFLDVTTSTGLGHLQKGHGIAFGDLDEDGDEDILADIGGAFTGDDFPDALFLNPTTDTHSVTLRLEGVSSPRSANGARVRIVTPTRTWHHVVGMWSSFGNNSHQVEAGLGAETTITRVEIDWPSGQREVVQNVPVDEVITLREGQGMSAHRPRQLITIEAEEHEMP